MKNIFISPIFLLLFHSYLSAQVFYYDSCKVPCNVCKPEPIKVEYKADPSKQIVLRVMNDRDVDVVSDCKVLDKINWTCQGYGLMQYGKQYAANGIAYWNASERSVEFENKYGKSYMCSYDKNLIGQFKLRQ